MLVLTRREGEVIRIGENITIRVWGARRVQVGVEAPAELPIRRGEIIARSGEPPACGPRDQPPEGPPRAA